MRKKREAESLIRLNLRREINRRLQFVQARMSETVVELAYARGKLKDLPARYRTPPGWALAAALRSWDTTFAPLSKLDKKMNEQVTLGDIWELYGIHSSIVSFIDNPTKEMTTQEKAVPALAKLRRVAAKSAARKFLKFLARVENKFSTVIPKPPLEALVEHATRKKKGLTESLTVDGEFVTMRRHNARLYYLIWFCWPKLEFSFSAAGIHNLMYEYFGEKFGDKTVEGILTELRKNGRDLEVLKVQP